MRQTLFVLTEKSVCVHESEERGRRHGDGEQSEHERLAESEEGWAGGKENDVLISFIPSGFIFGIKAEKDPQTKLW